ncbi:MAG: hypothetical protein HCA25_22165 [Dolichospermum sp. DET50]|nr:hypothetical protein [Dolichospermum sp. DET66]MBS3034877.1 hypothetical protein [Dolichospermum sp. DET67]MBS3040080.1 hypothetical protein [Dolichospermum sp. DET50]QSX67257.1 MAG: hypothetical protein EZY12_21425 [Dolichospermum sp. DET69]
MSVLKEPLATPSRFKGIFRYLLAKEHQKEKRNVLEQILSPNKLVERLLSTEEKASDKKAKHPMFHNNIRECIKSSLLVEIEDDIGINLMLSEAARNPQLGEYLLPDTLATLFFASGNQDEEDFGLLCAWFLAQDIYDFSGSWETVEKLVSEQKVGELLKISSGTLYSQMNDWMCYMGLAWSHALEGKKVIVPDPTAYIKRNLQHFFSNQEDKKLPIKEFIDRLAKKCPLFETGKFRDEVEANIGYRQPNYLSTSTAFALFRLQDEGYIQFIRDSDADLMLLPKANNEVDDNSKISHIILRG